MKYLISFILFWTVNAISFATVELPDDMNEMIVYGVDNPKSYITVYTDMNCGYCRKFHEEIPSLNASGIEVRYLPFLLEGEGSLSHQQFDAVYCSADRKKALTETKHGFLLPEASCETPVTKLYQQAKAAEVRGTPIIFSQDGERINKRKAKQIAKKLGVKYVAATPQEIEQFKPLHFDVEEMPQTFYRVEHDTQVYALPSSRMISSGQWPKGSMMTVIGRLINEDVDWLGYYSKRQKKLFYTPADNLQRIGEKADEKAITKVDRKEYQTLEATEMFFVPDENSPSIQQIPANSLLKITHEYLQGDEKWLVMKHSGNYYFMKATSLKLRG